MTDLEKFNKKDVGKKAKVTEPKISHWLGDEVEILEVGHSARAGYCIVKDSYGAEGWIRNKHIELIK